MEENLKTVFVLDHTPYFGISSEEHIFLDLKSKIPIPRLSKSLWTFSVESSVEYCRIVWDLFPTGKLVSSSNSSNLIVLIILFYF